MKKRDFIQQAAIQFMPELEWDIEMAIRYAEALWTRLGEKGYGDSTPRQSTPAGVNHYRSLNVRQREMFDKFWLAFDHKHGKQRAARRWAQLNISDKQLPGILDAAMATAAKRKNLPPSQTPIMAEGWLSDLRFEDHMETTVEKEQQRESQSIRQIQSVTGALKHAKFMAESTSDATWPKEIERLTEELRRLRAKEHAG